MGMFDYIICEATLPDGWQPGKIVFQTKDFDRDLVTHIITKDGRLLLERIDAVHEVPQSERPYPDADGILGIIGCMRTETSLHESNFHGRFRFYTHDADGNRHEYEAKFTNGKLDEIVTVETPD